MVHLVAHCRVPPVLIRVTGCRAGIQREPTKRASRVRRNLTYVTLFIASLVLIGDFISLVYNFLGGELTQRFVFKVLTVGLIAGSIFVYYLLDLRADEREPET